MYVLGKAYNLNTNRPVCLVIVMKRAGDGVLTAFFLVINVIHRGPYRQVDPKLERFRTQGVKMHLEGIRTRFSKENIHL